MSEAVLEVKNIKKSFRKNPVLQDISFNLYKGETLGLLGGSGSGKSVLLRTLIQLENIDGGEIWYHGKKINDLTENQLISIRMQISYSFQSGALFDSYTVFENLAFPLYEHTKLSDNAIEAKVKESLKMIELEGKENTMPSDLSGGMQKRVGMARAMIMNPDIILYDEPTAGLDPSNTQNVVKIIKKIKDHGNTSILVTHDMPVAMELCDRIILLHHGHITFTGTPEEFEKSDNPVVKSFISYAYFKRTQT
ncbi:MAG: ATP-binding cassette domain-containing protein [Pseudomonadota bacterium]